MARRPIAFLNAGDREAWTLFKTGRQLREFDKAIRKWNAALSIDANALTQVLNIGLAYGHKR